MDVTRGHRERSNVQMTGNAQRADNSCMLTTRHRDAADVNKNCAFYTFMAVRISQLEILTSVFFIENKIIPTNVVHIGRKIEKV